jgi:hypothetical protein
VHYGDVFALCVSAEEDRGPENPLEGTNQTPVLGTALLHGKRVEHLRGTFEGDPRILLADRERRQKNGNQPILPPRQPMLGCPVT